MSEVPSNSKPFELTPELIRERTGFKIYASFPDFHESGRISPDLHEEIERLAAELGEDNVLPSMYLDEAGNIQLGLFTKEPEDADNTDKHIGHAFGADDAPIDFMSEEFDR